GSVEPQTIGRSRSVVRASIRLIHRVEENNVTEKQAQRVVGISLVASAVVSALAPAPTAAQDQRALEEVVVTARRRAEAFQDVPVATTAFDQEATRSAGIERPRDFVALTPNVTLVETQNQGTSFLTIRGISQARNSEPSAAILVDGVLLTNP